MARQRVCDICGDSGQIVTFKLRRKWRLIKWFHIMDLPGADMRNWKKQDICDKCMNGILEGIGQKLTRRWPAN